MTLLCYYAMLKFEIHEVMSNVVKDYVILLRYAVKAGCMDLLVNIKQIQKSH